MNINVIAGIITIILTVIMMLIEKSTIGIVMAALGFTLSVILTTYNIIRFRNARKK